jgi:hypothetical protein
MTALRIEVTLRRENSTKDFEKEIHAFGKTFHFSRITSRAIDVKEVIAVYLPEKE